MQVHTVAFAASAVSPANASFALPVVQDQFFSASGSTAFLIPEQMKVLAGFAIGPSLLRARINSPSLLRVGYPSIRPIQQSPTPLTDPNMMMLYDNPLLVPPGEPVGVDAVIGNNNDPSISLLWFVSGPLSPSPRGESFWLRYTAATTQSDGKTSVIAPLRWSQLGPTFDQSIPSGTYAVIGFEHTGPSAVAARIIFPESVYRPATVAMTTVGARTAQIAYDGSLGTLGSFRTVAPPSIEVLCTSPDVATHEGYLRVVRVGDLGAQPNSTYCPPQPQGVPGPPPPAPVFSKIRPPVRPPRPPVLPGQPRSST